MTNEEHLQLVVDCEARERRLSAWEHDFIVSIREQLDAGKTLTTPQAEKLEEVWDRVTEKG